MQALLLVVALAAYASAVTPVSSLNAGNYLGRWYQMYGDAFTQDTFGLGSVCATADYGVYAAHNISVHNAARLGHPYGELYIIDGYAVQSETHQGELSVVFPGQKVDGPYWIFGLGPQTSSDDAVCAPTCYEWALVSDEVNVSLFVLARNSTTFVNEYESEILATVQSEGFTKAWNKPVAVYQGSECEYTPVPSL